MTRGLLDLWTIPLSPAPPELEQLLSADEFERANRFRFKHLRDSFVAARTGLRRILSTYTTQTPAAIRFELGIRSKPRLFPHTGLEFNLSHSGHLALLAVTVDTEIGVDIEAHRPMPDLFDIAQRFFCPEECADLEAVMPDRRMEAFFRCWTRKEAYIKAIGEGLHAPLDQFRVNLAPNIEARFVHIDHSDAEAAQWSLHSLSVPKGYSAAVAYKGSPKELRFRSFTSLA